CASAGCWPAGCRCHPPARRTARHDLRAAPGAALAVCCPVRTLGTGEMAEQKKSGGFLRFLRGLWRGVDLTRRAVFNLLFLLVLVLVLVAVFSDGPVLRERSALVLAPAGAIVEQYSVDPVERALARLVGEEQPETQLRDILRALDVAARDKRIERLVIRPDRIGSVGYAALREIGAAIQRFKESGKQVVAYADNLGQQQYYLAAFADEVYLHPEGGLLLEGLGRYRMYYREALQDKLGV